MAETVSVVAADGRNRLACVVQGAVVVSAHAFFVVILVVGLLDNVEHIFHHRLNLISKLRRIVAENSHSTFQQNVVNGRGNRVAFSQFFGTFSEFSGSIHLFTSL